MKDASKEIQLKPATTDRASPIISTEVMKESDVTDATSNSSTIDLLPSFYSDLC